MIPTVQEFERFHAENRDLAAAMALRIVQEQARCGRRRSRRADPRMAFLGSVR
jgi:hypothetical protein